MQKKENRLLHGPNVLAISDFSEASFKVIYAAHEWCQRTGGSLTVLHINHISEEGLAGSTGSPVTHRELHEKLEVQLNELGLHAITIVRMGLEQEILLELVQEMNFDLLVVQPQYLKERSIVVKDLGVPVLSIDRPLGPKTALLIHAEEDFGTSLRFYTHLQDMFPQMGEVLCLVQDHPGLYSLDRQVTTRELYSFERSAAEKKKAVVQKLEKHSPQNHQWVAKVQHSREPVLTEHLAEVLEEEKRDLFIFRAQYFGEDRQRHLFKEALDLVIRAGQNFLVLN